MHGAGPRRTPDGDKVRELQWLIRMTGAWLSRGVVEYATGKSGERYLLVRNSVLLFKIYNSGF